MLNRKQSQTVLTLAAIVVLGRSIIKRLLVRKRVKSLIGKRVADRKTEEENAQKVVDVFYSKNVISDDTKQTILSSGVSELADKIAKGVWKSSTVLVVYVENALKNNKKFNFVTAWKVEEAINLANQLDKHLEQTGKTTGPLHGVPFTVKENIGVKGVPPTMGIVKNCTKIAQQNSLVVSLLLEAGAIPFCTTNVPQTMISFECSNPIYGRTVNHINQKYTCGGSSGGEGCSIGSSSSPLGLGTDIGGSVRIPAHFSGIFSFKPSFNRIPSQGVGSSMPGQETIPGVVGIMGRSSDDLLVAFKAILEGKPWEKEGFTIILPFREEIYRGVTSRKLVIGYYLEDPFVPVSPACQRAVQMAVNALKLQGHTLVPFAPPRFEQSVYLYYSLLSCGGFEHFLNLLKDEPLEDFVAATISFAKVPRIVRHATIYLAWFLGKKIESRLVASLKSRPITGLYDLTLQRNSFRDEFSTQWNKSGPGGSSIDALICPVHPLPAVPHFLSKTIGWSTIYTGMYNILDYSAGTLKVTTVDKVKDVAVGPYKQPASNNIIQKNLSSIYNPDEMHGMPVSVQVVARRLQEEVVMGVMRVLEDALPKKAELPNH